MRILNKTVGERRFSMVNMGDDAEISNLFHNAVLFNLLFTRGKYILRGKIINNCLTVNGQRAESGGRTSDGEERGSYL